MRAFGAARLLWEAVSFAAARLCRGLLRKRAAFSRWDRRTSGMASFDARSKSLLRGRGSRAFPARRSGRHPGEFPAQAGGAGAVFRLCVDCPVNARERMRNAREIAGHVAGRVLYASAFLAGFNENLVNMALMSIMGEYGVDSVAAQWLVTGYMIVATIVVMCMAFMYRRFKLRPLYFAAAAFTLVGSVMGLFATSFELLMAARLVQAAGSGIFIPLMMNTVMVVVPKHKLGTFLSIGGCMITFGPALAPTVCGALVTSAGWHSVFAVPLAAMAVLALMALFAVKNMGFSPAHLDIPSTVLSAAFLCALSLGLVELTIDIPLAVGSLAVAVVMAALFVLRQLRCEHPLIDLTPMKSRAFWPSVVLTTIAMMGSFSMSVLLPLYLEGGTGLTAFAVGLLMLIPVLANAGTTLLGGRIMDTRGEWPLLPAGFAAIAAGFALMAALAPTLSLPAAFVAALLIMGGTGFIFSPSQTAGLRTLPAEMNPFGVAISTTFVRIAACIGPSLYTGIMSTAQAGALAAGAGEALATAQGFSIAMVVAACIAAAGCALALVYSRAAVKRDVKRAGSM